MSVSLEQQTAQLDAYKIAKEYGAPVTLNVRAESNVVRDRYNSIEARPSAQSVTVSCFPITYAPTERDLVRAGLKEMADVVVYVPVYAMDQAGLGYDQIDLTRSSVVVDGRTLRLREKARASQFGTVWLYYTLGLVLPT